MKSYFAKQRILYCVTFSLGCWFAAACASEEADPGAAKAAITNGSLDGEGHPNVGAMVYRRNEPAGPTPRVTCSGTLISQRLFLTAGHCTEAHLGKLAAGTNKITDYGVSFSATEAQNESTWIPVVAMVTNPAYGTNSSNDLGVLVLGTPQKTIAPVTLAPLGLLETLKLANTKGDSTTDIPFRLQAVGYGTLLDYLPQPTVVPMDGQRRYGEGDYRTFNKQMLTIFQNNIPKGASGTCFGDSGGPVFIHANINGKDVEYQVAATSWGDAACVAIGKYQRIDIKESADFIANMKALYPDPQ